MRESRKNNFQLFKILSILFLFHLVTSSNQYQAQIANYVSNGSFEIKYDCDPPNNLSKAIYWNNIGTDTTAIGGILYSTDSNCYANAPSIPLLGFQYPYSGNTFARMGFYCMSPCQYIYSRGYPKNRLKEPLIANKTYCVKMQIVRQETSPYAVSNIGFYFGNETTDTIKLSNAPITYLNPQVKNPSNNIISDTLNWTPITGTFVADGSEKYMIIGNFDSNASTTYSLVDTSFGNGVWAEYFIDAISCIELNLPAYAGPDKSIIPGDSVYIGRESDFAIDPGCIWYQLPNTTTALDTSSGIWVNPTSTSTYLVKQTLDCSPEKWDTVVVYMNPVGLSDLSQFENELTLFPNPANEFVELRVSDQALFKKFKRLQIFNAYSQLIREEEISFKESSINIKTSELANGVYFIRILSDENKSIEKKLIISR